MRSHYVITVLFVVCSSFVADNAGAHSSTEGTVIVLTNWSKKILDFNVQRFSGEKVFLSWHTEGDPPQIVYEVLRKHKKLSQFISLGNIQPKSREGGVADYRFIDDNNYHDSSYYCLKKTNPDSVVFYSITKGVAGVGKNR